MEEVEGKYLYPEPFFWTLFRLAKFGYVSLPNVVKPPCKLWISRGFENSACCCWFQFCNNDFVPIVRHWTGRHLR